MEKRKERGETQDELAQHVGVSRQTISAIEKGNYSPSIELSLKLANHFKTKVDNLFTL